MTNKTECEKCGEDVGRFKFLKKIGKKRYCKDCARRLRIEKRNKMIEDSPNLKEDLNILLNKERRGYRRRKIGIRRGPGRPKAEAKDFPQIKGSKISKTKEISSCYITFQEKQNYLRVLVSRGLSFEEAKERLSNLVESQKKVREKMKEKGKSEEEIKIKQQAMLEDLWR